MEAILINDEAGFIEAYTYSEERARKEMPTKFPCILVLKNLGGGLTGEYVHHQILFFPQKTINADDYFNGFLIGLATEE